MQSILRGKGLPIASKRVSTTQRSTVSSSRLLQGATSVRFTTKGSRSPIFSNVGSRSFSVASEQAQAAYTASELETRSQYANVLRLITAYRRYGHILADLDPLQLEKKSPPPELDLKRYDLEKLLGSNKQIPLPGLINMGENKKTATLEEIINYCKTVYCGTVGSEFLYLQQVDQRRWFSDQIESLPNKKLTKDEKIRAYKLIAEAEAFDHFMQKKFPYVKRYALEGTESMMVATDTVFKSARDSSIDNIIIGMPHRGRLNLLVGLLDYPASQLFWKVKGESELPNGVIGIGDVLSHIGTTVDLVDENSRKLHVSLLQNPSHLEAISPVALGKTRAKQDEDSKKRNSMGLLYHGDASFYGQGIISETLALSKLSEFKTDGSIHIIVNNQLGFTTPQISHGRSSRYSADIGKMIDIPVIHVNADNPEDVIKCCKLAMDYRNTFNSDIIIDIIGYRRHGHNELDEPSFTQPLMYNKIRSRQSVVKLYGNQLQKEGILTEKEAQDIISKFDEKLDQSFKNSSPPIKANHLEGKWKGIIQARDVTKKVDTGMDINKLKDIALSSVNIPDRIKVHDRLKRTFIQRRMDDINKDILDWATCESIAFGTVLLNGNNVRLSGQDVGRGTFSHRHAEIIDQLTEERYVPLNHMSNKQGKLSAVNSPLSELAVLGFEYGYSWENPNNLVLWEAQFGDFANGAQIIIDQFISSGESKWLYQSGLVMLLPHGYDGAGPEHSSSRIERFLQLTDSDSIDIYNSNNNNNTNMIIINPTTPSNYYHSLRRQVISNYRKPLIIISPKAILRHPKAISKFSDLSPGTHFQSVLSDNSVSPDKVDRVIFCSGKIYYDLVELREQRGYHGNTAIIRIEELSPFPLNRIKEEIDKYNNNNTNIKYIWCQEESQNAGAWSYIFPRLSKLINIDYIGRPPCPASAVGTSPAHKKEWLNIVQSVFPK